MTGKSASELCDYRRLCARKEEAVQVAHAPPSLSYFPVWARTKCLIRLRLPLFFILLLSRFLFIRMQEERVSIGCCFVAFQRRRACSSFARYPSTDAQQQTPNMDDITLRVWQSSVPSIALELCPRALHRCHDGTFDR